jgi:hypothetical protein
MSFKIDKHNKCKVCNEVIWNRNINAIYCKECVEQIRKNKARPIVIQVINNEKYMYEDLLITDEMKNKLDMKGYVYEVIKENEEIGLYVVNIPNQRGQVKPI